MSVTSTLLRHVANNASTIAAGVIRLVEEDHDHDHAHDSGPTSADHIYAAKMASIPVIFVIVALAASLPWILKRLQKAKSLMIFLICFSAGAMLGIGFLHMIPETREVWEMYLGGDEHAHAEGEQAHSDADPHTDQTNKEVAPVPLSSGSNFLSSNFQAQRILQRVPVSLVSMTSSSTTASASPSTRRRQTSPRTLHSSSSSSSSSSSARSSRRRGANMRSLEEAAAPAQAEGGHHHPYPYTELIAASTVLLLVALEFLLIRYLGKRGTTAAHHGHAHCDTDIAGHAHGNEDDAEHDHNDDHDNSRLRQHGFDTLPSPPAATISSNIAGAVHDIGKNCDVSCDPSIEPGLMGIGASKSSPSIRSAKSPCASIEMSDMAPLDMQPSSASSPMPSPKVVSLNNASSSPSANGAVTPPPPYMNGKGESPVVIVTSPLVLVTSPVTNDVSPSGSIHEDDKHGHHHHHHDHDKQGEKHDEDDEEREANEFVIMTPEEREAARQRKLHIDAYISALAICVHCLFNGLALGADRSSPTQFWAFFAASLGHKLMDGFAIGVPIYRAQLPRWLTILIIVTVASATPLGVVIGYTVSNANESHLARAIVMALSTGSFIFVALFELLPSALRSSSWLLLKLLIVFVGFAGMAIVAKWT